MSERQPISKRLRFDIFKRDEFTCQYCGRKPPAVLLEVDHVISVSEGGGNDDHNLVTSCFDCNRGKGAQSLSITPIDVAEKAERLRERQQQVRAYEEMLTEARFFEDAVIDDVIGRYETAFDGWTLKDSARPSIRMFLQRLPPSEVIGAMELACSRVNGDRAFRYFCGVCWRKIRGD